MHFVVEAKHIILGSAVLLGHYWLATTEKLAVKVVVKAALKRLLEGKTNMKVLKSWLDGAVVLGWQSGSLLLAIDGTVGGGKAAGIISGQAQIKLAAVAAVEGLAEDEINALVAQHEPSILPVVQAIEGFLNQGLTALG